ncbi:MULTISPECIES: hypothetical protein [Chryseobacterium]|uniref:Uncharacterized protein n=1 Tax=Chryseobacterium taihuense TaxID=1141221 RepID=A0A4U8WEK4_9FLAO|nr:MULTISPECIES: hypothetical protein [Chryseobacterium]QQV01890.1 hypothetical protein I6I61_12460 [Chryseobacterium sp. FDAARGOS 1104]VFB04887.1 Uncharacterised protein [Chryseobacterium taihuense]
MKKTLSILTCGLLVIIVFIMDYPLKKKTLYGKYINMNYQNSTCCVEAPHEPDTLILFSNGNFESRFFGRGQFKVSDGISPKIEFHYKSFDKSILYSTYFLNKLFDKPKIILNADTNHVYVKMN